MSRPGPCELPQSAAALEEMLSSHRILCAARRDALRIMGEHAYGVVPFEPEAHDLATRAYADARRQCAALELRMDALRDVLDYAAQLAPFVAALDENGE